MPLDAPLSMPHWTALHCLVPSRSRSAGALAAAHAFSVADNDTGAGLPLPAAMTHGHIQCADHNPSQSPDLFCTASGQSCPNLVSDCLMALLLITVQGNIAQWRKKEGATIAPGDVLAEVETDKATIEWESQEEGFLAKIVLGDGARLVPMPAVCQLAAGTWLLQSVLEQAVKRGGSEVGRGANPNATNAASSGCSRPW